MSAVRISAVDTGYSLPVVAVGEKMFADRPYPFEAELPVFPGIFLIIPSEEIGEMPLEDLMECVSSPRYVSTGLLIMLHVDNFEMCSSYKISLWFNNGETGVF